MKRLVSLVLVSIFVLPCVAAEPTPRLHFQAGGFSIAPLEGKSDTTAVQALMMFLPVSDAFAPNVNVQIQPYKGTIKEYAELSKGQFKAGNFTVLKEEFSPTSVVWEYSGALQNRKLHWYARAELGDGKVYLVTATATETQWETVSAKLKACVQSFKTEKGEQDTSSSHR
jgi:hypothetical protein